MEGKVEKMSIPNPGVKCIVNTCHYYSSGDHCTASMIEVQPQNAANTEETDCVTFIPE
jgi:Domain of Unknown Function (DUF1540).